VSKNRNVGATTTNLNSQRIYAFEYRGTKLQGQDS